MHRSSQFKCAPSGWRVLTFAILALLFVGVLSFGTAVPVAHAAVVITVDRTDDPSPVPSACTGADNDCSLRGAIQYANNTLNPPTEIVLAHGAVYTLSASTGGALSISKDTTIDYDGIICGVPPASCPATIRGGTGWANRIITVNFGAHVQITAVIIRNGNLAGTGGGIYNNGHLTLNSVTVRNNTATMNGGGILNSTGTLTITNSSVFSNTVTTNGYTGGGLYNESGTVTISGSAFTYNSANNGGGIASNGGSLSLTSTDVTTNTLTTNGHGAGLYAHNALSITGGSISGNTAVGQNAMGGGLYFDGTGTATINGTQITTNRLTTYGGIGGGIACTGSGATMNLTNVTLNYNTATGGGGIDSTCGSLNITGGTVNANTGSGVNVRGGGNLTMYGTTVYGNQTTLSGAGVYLETTSSTITASTISTNRSTFTAADGGGIYLSAGSLIVDSSTVMSNTLPGANTQGGGIFVGQSSTTMLSVINSAIVSNTAQLGGGLGVQDLAEIVNTTISGNIAAGGGGGIQELYAGDSALSLLNVTISNNQAPSGGGVSMGNQAHIKNSLIAGNTSPVGPDCNGNFDSSYASYNILGNSEHCYGLTNGVNGNIVGTTAQPLTVGLGSLANNGGNGRLTHALLTGSLAINTADPNAAACPSPDERGISRPQNGRCDIGAFEYTGVDSPVPQITGLSPNVRTYTCGGVIMPLTVYGSNFVYSSVVQWGGSPRTTIYVSPTQLTALIDEIYFQDLCTPGDVDVTVFNPGPGGGTSNVAHFTLLPYFINYLPFLNK